MIKKNLEVLKRSINEFKPNWLEKTSEEKQKLINEYNKDPLNFKPEFKSYIWRSIAQKLSEIFDYKCAYCESLIKATGDEIEHYRPKRKVQDGLCGNNAEHPGYFWLAYEISNLLPSCPACNNAKGTKFPIKEQRVCDPECTIEILKGEKPLLLNPFMDIPNDHFGFDHEVEGIIYGKTERGKETVRILKLKRLGDLYRRELSALLPEFFSFFVTVRNGLITNPDQPFIRNNMQYSEYLRHGLLNYLQNEFQQDFLEYF